MTRILKATKKDKLSKEWRLLDHIHYGRSIKWREEEFGFKAVEDGQIVGTIYGRYEPGVVYISNLIIVEKARGKGIGTMLVEKAEGFGRQLGAHRAWLLTGKDWSENLFYKKLGFKMVAELPDFYFHKDFVVYSREIN